MPDDDDDLDLPDDVQDATFRNADAEDGGDGGGDDDAWEDPRNQPHTANEVFNPSTLRWEPKGGGTSNDPFNVMKDSASLGLGLSSDADITPSNQTTDDHERRIKWLEEKIDNDPDDNPDGADTTAATSSKTLDMGTTSVDTTTYDSKSDLKNLVLQVGTHYIDTSAHKVYIRQRTITITVNQTGTAFLRIQVGAESSVIEVDGSVCT